jgi:hypothetical protein
MSTASPGSYRTLSLFVIGALLLACPDGRAAERVLVTVSGQRVSPQVQCLSEELLTDLWRRQTGQEAFSARQLEAAVAAQRMTCDELRSASQVGRIVDLSIATLGQKLVLSVKVVNVVETRLEARTSRISNGDAPLAPLMAQLVAELTGQPLLTVLPALEALQTRCAGATPEDFTSKRLAQLCPPPTAPATPAAAPR